MKARTYTMNSTATAPSLRPSLDRIRRVAPAAATLAVASLLGAALVVAPTDRIGATARDNLSCGTCWLLVAGGVTGTYLAGTGRRCGWLILLGMQPLWIAYALVTDQYGFLPGSLAYAAAQFNGYMRISSTGTQG